MVVIKLKMAMHTQRTVEKKRNSIGIACELNGNGGGKRKVSGRETPSSSSSSLTYKRKIKVISSTWTV